MPSFRRTAALAGAGLIAVGLGAPALLLGFGYVRFRMHERAIVEKMDQYYVNLTVPGREQYLLESDEVFEVPYMASKWAVAAEPTRIYDAHDRLMGEFVTEKGVYVRDPALLPAFLKKALVASEDGNFYRHHGVNWRALGRAMLVNLRSLHIRQGGSTLTQQLAKQMFTTRHKTLGRKAFELFCARKLEDKFTKDQILLMYLNFAYFGHGCFGIESAAQYYFGKPASALQLPESAMLVGLIPNPKRYSPFENPALSDARTRTVLTRMARLGFIPASEIGRYAEEAKENLAAAHPRPPEVSFWRMRVNEAPYAVETVRRELERRYSKDRILKGGLRVHTTFDLDVQRPAQEALRAGLARLQREIGVSTGPALQGGLAAVDPGTGAILALVGGRGFDFQNQLNRATDIHRPIGSAVKPFVYAAAFASGRFHPQDRMVDEPITFRTGGRVWHPQNYERKYLGEVTLSTAVYQSINTVAIRVLEQTGVEAVIGLLSKATGAPPDRFPRNLTLALGTADLSPLEMARGYSIFVNGGRSPEPYFLRSIEDRDGKPIETFPPPAASAPVLDPAVCSTMTVVLHGVLGPGGTGHLAAAEAGLTVPAGGKTGTTDEYRDAWFAGFTADISAAVWVGYDDMRYGLGRSGTGGRIAAPIWARFISAVYRDRPARPLP